jgi:hypothetical protein
MSALLSLFIWPAGLARAEGPDQAQIVVQFDNGQVIVRQIRFAGPISGYEALRLTGLELVTESMSFGLAICGIGGVGDPAGSCFSSGFWSSYYWDGQGWATYMVGAGDSVINDKAIELWSWQPNFTSLELPAAPPITAAATGLEWLKSQQSDANGGYGNPGNSVEVLMTLGANRLDATEWRRQVNNPSLADYIQGNSASFANSNAGGAGKLAVGLAATAGCWPVGAKKPLDYYQATTGAFSSGSGHQAWGMMGTRALNQAIPALAGQKLRSLAQSNGGWEWFPGWGTDTNSTALAIQALLAAGELPGSPPISQGLAYLDQAQNGDGGFPYDPDSPFVTSSDTNSTAYVVQALLAAGEVVTGTRWTVAGGQTPLSYLLSRQLADGGFEWQAGQGQSNTIATWQVIPALLGQPFPLQARPVAACFGVHLPLVVKP